MKQVESYKKNLKGAACNTFVLGVLVIIQLNNNEDTISDFAAVAFIALLASAIFLWIRGTKQYIDYRLQEIVKGNQEA